MHGDFEAQRHWMEITVNLPKEEWYFNGTANDLMYWGLDYPPFTFCFSLSSFPFVHSFDVGLWFRAYVSLWFGYLAQWVCPELVELHASRGIETAGTKLFMRLSVLFTDLVLGMTSVVLVWRYVCRHKGTQCDMPQGLAWLAVLLLNPSLILIDHGHFQYNSVSLGLTLLAVLSLFKDRPLVC